MKLTLSIVNNEDARLLLDALSEKGRRAVLTHAVGGRLQDNMAVILAGVEDNALDDTLAVIREICPTRSQYANPLPPVMEPGEMFAPLPVEVEEKGATVYVLNVDQFYQY